MGILSLILMLSPVMVYGNFFVTYPGEYYEYGEIKDYPDEQTPGLSDPSDCFYHDCMYNNPRTCCDEPNVCGNVAWCKGIEFCKRAKASLIKEFRPDIEIGRLAWWRYCFNKFNISISATPEVVSECENNQLPLYEFRRRLCCLAANVCKPPEDTYSAPEQCYHDLTCGGDSGCCLYYGIGIGCPLPRCDNRPFCDEQCHYNVQNWGQCCEYFELCDTPLCDHCDNC